MKFNKLVLSLLIFALFGPMVHVNAMDKNNNNEQQNIPWKELKASKLTNDKGYTHYAISGGLYFVKHQTGRIDLMPATSVSDFSSSFSQIPMQGVLNNPGATSFIAGVLSGLTFANFGFSAENSTKGGFFAAACTYLGLNAWRFFAKPKAQGLLTDSTSESFKVVNLREGEELNNKDQKESEVGSLDQESFMQQKQDLQNTIKDTRNKRIARQFNQQGKDPLK